MNNATSDLVSIDETSLATVNGGGADRPHSAARFPEQTAQHKLSADRAAASKRYGRPPETASGQFARDILSLVPGVNGEIVHRVMRGVVEGTAWNGLVPGAL